MMIDGVIWLLVADLVIILMLMIPVTGRTKLVALFERGWELLDAEIAGVCAES